MRRARHAGRAAAGRVAAGRAAAGHGLALLPRSATAGAPGAVVVPLTGPRIVHQVEIVHAGIPTGAAQALVAALSPGR